MTPLEEKNLEAKTAEELVDWHDEPVKATVTPEQYEKLKDTPVLKVNDAIYVHRDKVIEMLGKFAEEQLTETRKRVEELTSVLRKIHSMSLYAQHQMDEGRQGYLPYDLFDEVEEALNPKQ
jgi:hypothetical protein